MEGHQLDHAVREYGNSLRLFNAIRFTVLFSAKLCLLRKCLKIEFYLTTKQFSSELVNFRSSIVPVLEVDEYVTQIKLLMLKIILVQIHIDDDNLALIKSKLLFVEKAVSVATICGALFSLIAILVTAVYVFYRVLKSFNSLFNLSL